jgi:hypothetical protein
MVQTYDCKKNIKVIVWGYSWDLRRTSFYIINKDFESLKYMYSANSYLEVLEAEIWLVYQAIDLGYVFMQDNALIHTVKKITE